jgi:hypothetical protein
LWLQKIEKFNLELMRSICMVTAAGIKEKSLEADTGILPLGYSVAFGSRRPYLEIFLSTQEDVPL